jgi:enterochelin esterase-like enzyme
MRLDGTAIVVVALAVVAGTAAALALLWDRTGPWRRAGVAVACVLAVAVTAALQLNRLIEAYPTWSALTGVRAAAGDTASGESAVPAVAPRDPAHTGGSHVFSVRVPGRVSGVTLPMYVYLPPGYARDRHRRYPVIEAMHGYPGSPRTWIRRLDVQGWLDREISAGRMAPTVVLFPYQTPQQLLDTECTNLVHGPHAEAFLTADVPAYARDHFRVRADRAAWGTIGYSAGGFCATNLTLRHPAEYAAAASLSGYAGPGIKVGDGSENTTNNDLWRLTHLAQPPVALYLAWAADDGPTSRNSLAIARLCHAPITVTMAVLAHGGHSDAAWQAMEAPAFDWLSAHLARPIA